MIIVAVIIVWYLKFTLAIPGSFSRTRNKSTLEVIANSIWTSFCTQILRDFFFLMRIPYQKFLRLAYHYKKIGAITTFLNIRIAPKNVGIGQKHLFRCFFPWCFLPLRNECGNRSVWSTLVLFQTGGIGPSSFETLLWCSFLFFSFFFFLCQDILHQQFQDLYRRFFKMKIAGIGVSISF